MVKGREKWFMFNLNEIRLMYIILHTISAISNGEEKSCHEKEWVQNGKFETLHGGLSFKI